MPSSRNRLERGHILAGIDLVEFHELNPAVIVLEDEERVDECDDVAVYESFDLRQDSSGESISRESDNQQLDGTECHVFLLAVG